MSHHIGSNQVMTHRSRLAVLDFDVISETMLHWITRAAAKTQPLSRTENGQTDYRSGLAGSTWRNRRTKKTTYLLTGCSAMVSHSIRSLKSLFVSYRFVAGALLLRHNRSRRQPEAKVSARARARLDVDFKIWDPPTHLG